jgi:pimeloyl-ACP methyl ester carboxylesterase
MPAAVGESELTVAGVRSPLLEAGPEGASEAVVFLHGNPGSSEDWRELAGRVGEFVRAVAFDLPGFGGCDRPGGFDCSVESYGEWIGRALGELGVERAHLVVHDFGGPFGFAWAERDPDALASLVAFNTGMLTGRRWHFWARTWRRPVIGELTMLWIPRGRFEKALSAGAAKPLPDDFLERMYRDYDRTTRTTVLKLYRAADVPHPAGRRWIEAFSGREIPALFVWGDRDPFVLENAVEHLRSAFPAAEVAHLPDSAHFPFADDPEGTAAAVIPFLRERL